MIIEVFAAIVIFWFVGNHLFFKHINSKDEDPEEKRKFLEEQRERLKRWKD